MTDLSEFAKSIWKNFKKINFLNTFFILLSAASANFAAYIAYFDINAFILVDTTTIARHLIGVIILFAMVSGALTALFSILPNYMLSLERLRQRTKLGKLIKGFSDEEMVVIGKLCSSLVARYVLTIMLFGMFYVGVMYTASIFILMFLVLLIFIVPTLNENEHDVDKDKHNPGSEASESPVPVASNDKQWVQDSLKRFKAKVMSYHYFQEWALSIKNLEQDFLLAKSKIENGEVSQLFFSRLGFFIMFASLCFGVARAMFVEENIHVRLNGSNDELVLYLTTSSGLGFYQKSSEHITFVSWDNIKKLDFSPSKRRSIAQ